MAFFAAYIASYPRPLHGRPTVHFAQDNVDYVLSQRFATGHGYRLPQQHYAQLPADIRPALTPRDAATVDGYVLPKDFAGPVLTYGAAFRLWRPLVMGLNAFFGIVSGLLVAAIAAELTRDSRARPWVIGAGLLLWLSYPPLFVTSSYLVRSDTLNASACLVCVLFFIRYWRSQQRNDLVWFSLGAGASLLMRYPDVLLVAPLLIALATARRLTWRRGLLLIAIIVPFIGIILGFNAALYGSPFTTGYAVGNRLLKQTANFAGESFLQFDPMIVKNYVKFYVVRWPTILGPPLIGAAAGIWLARTRPSDRAVYASLLVATIVFAGYYAGLDAWGASQAAVNAAVLRYLFPALAVWTVFLAIAVFDLTRRRRLAPLIVGALLLAYLWTAWAAPSGVHRRAQIMARLRAVRFATIAATPPNALIATSGHDRELWPDRQPLTLTYLLHNVRPVEKGMRRGWDVIPSGTRFTDVARRIIERRIPLYLLADIPRTSLDEYRRALRADHLELIRVDPSIPLYRVSLDNG